MSLHIARIIDYPNLKISEYMNMMNEMGKELTSQIKNTKEYETNPYY